MILSITQARLSSSRFPGKVLQNIADKSLLEMHLNRVSKSTIIDKIIVATSIQKEDDIIAEHVESLGYECFRGDLNNVLKRFYDAVQYYNPDLIVRLTADCPFIDSEVIDDTIRLLLNNNADYASNIYPPTYPDGLDCEIFTKSALLTAYAEAITTVDLEHVTPYIRNNSSLAGKNKFKSVNFESNINTSDYRLTVDNPEDLIVIEYLYRDLGLDASYTDIVDYLHNNPLAISANKHLKRNEGMIAEISKDIQLRNITNFTKSNEYRSKIHDLIPGGAHTYSKGDDQFPLLSPAAIQYGKGSKIFDIDGNEYLDCPMGLTSVTIGHAYQPVIDAVAKSMQLGANYQRPSYLEMEMAEKFLALVPAHDMIKFAKNGSTATTAATKLARAYTGRKLIAIPIDHPFYSYDDWFIGKTVCDFGIPDEIKGLSVTYNGGDLNTLEDLFRQYPDQIACVISEPERSVDEGEYPLEQLIQLTQSNGALFIQDEMITGFKYDLPGVIKNNKTMPDLATWGKGIANGFAFCALTGKKEIMELGGIRNEGAQKLFLISTTHGAEVHSLTAGIATIDAYQTHNIIQHNHSIGARFIKVCNEIISKHNLQAHIHVYNCNWMPIMSVKDNTGAVSAGLRTLVMQEMIKRGVLFQGAFVPCFAHTIEDINYFATAFDETLYIYNEALKLGYENLLVGPVAKGVFRKIL
ncbi:MAG: glutamate-1-semialdehyde 2,1-aminomutase [Bacteroidota bacterium]|nr:glutamate-1-semialdehyde 2,1-aminomutase [Bacteroidota bacterium]